MYQINLNILLEFKKVKLGTRHLLCINLVSWNAVTLLFQCYYAVRYRLNYCFDTFNLTFASLVSLWRTLSEFLVLLKSLDNDILHFEYTKFQIKKYEYLGIIFCVSTKSSCKTNGIFCSEWFGSLNVNFRHLIVSMGL